jgi:hypothetical protein
MRRSAATLLKSLICSVVVESFGRQIGPAQCNDGITAGYMDIADLRSDLLTKNGDSVVTLCPDAAFDLTVEPLTISQSVILKCGEDGSFLNNCTFDGGDHQIIVEGDLASIEFQGLTFQFSEQTSVSILATDSSVTFFDCLWRYHVGDTIVVIGEAYSVIGNITTTLHTDSNWTDANGNVTGSTNSSELFNHTDVLGDPEGAMLANGTGNPDDALQYSPNATEETPIDPLPGTGDTVDRPTHLDHANGNQTVSRMRKRSHHVGRRLSSINTSVHFDRCEFSVSFAGSPRLSSPVHT